MYYFLGVRLFQYYVGFNSLSHDNDHLHARVRLNILPFLDLLLAGASCMCIDKNSPIILLTKIVPSICVPTKRFCVNKIKRMSPIIDCLYFQFFRYDNILH